MADDPRVQQLLDELLERKATPEEVCEGCVELLPIVRAHWQQICTVRGDLDILFPPDSTENRPVWPVEGLPAIPGYEVETVLGHGGMGVVFRARQVRLNRSVALKMPLLGPWASPRALARFLREAKAIGGLHHEHIVQVFDAGEVHGQPYFAMELVDGGSLARRLEGQPQPSTRAAELVATLAGAVQVAHAAGIIHRDLKPGNVLLSGDGTPKISDFGLARHLEGEAGLTPSGAAIGTPSYMAPEEAQGAADAIGPAIDIYALGAILYELLTGRPPFRGESAAATIHQVIHQEPVPPSRLNSTVPRDLETICLKCLLKEPRKRYATADELAADVGRFLRHEPIQARPTGVVDHLVRWVRRRPAAAGLLAALVALVLVAGIGAGLQYRQWTAARDRQAQADREVRGVLASACGPLGEAWLAQDLAKLTEALAEGSRAVDLARNGLASAAVVQEAEAFRADADLRLTQAKKNSALREAVLDVAAPQEAGFEGPEELGGTGAPARPSLDEQYATAFRRWGLDVDRAAEAEMVQRLGAEPDVVAQEVIAALDSWMLERRRLKRPEAEWRRLLRAAEQLDHSQQRRRLRALLLGQSQPRAASAAAFVGTPSCLTLWQLTLGDDWQQLREVRRKINPRTDSVLTVVLVAKAYAGVGDAAESEQLLSEAATARPDAVMVLDALGKLLERQGPSRLANAIEYYRAARAQRPRLGDALSSALIRDHRPAEAERVVRGLFYQQVETPILWNTLGVALDEQKKRKAAEAAYRRAIAAAPDFAAAHANLGMCLGDQQQYEVAELACRKAVELRPDWADGYHYLACILRKRNKHSAEEEAYRQGIARRPAWAEAYYNLGNALSRRGQYAAAEVAYRKAAEIRPDFAQAHNNLGMSLNEQQKPGAAESFRRAIALKSGYPEPHSNLGMVLANQGRHAEAELAFRQAIALRPEFAVPHFNLAHTLTRQARFDEALAMAKKGLDLLPARDPLRQRVQPLLQQCQRYVSLDARLPVVLRGVERPANGAEGIEFGRLCVLKKLYAAGARLSGDALTAEPKLADDVPGSARYDAACAAALAGCARGLDTYTLDDRDRARWRRQARQWLREDLAWWGRALDHGNAQTKAEVQRKMLYWPTDSDLAGLREPGALEAMSPDERKECLALWQEVAALLSRVQSNK